jgi:hypothetical protein
MVGYDQGWNKYCHTGLVLKLRVPGSHGERHYMDYYFLSFFTSRTVFSYHFPLSNDFVKIHMVYIT